MPKVKGYRNEMKKERKKNFLPTSVFGYIRIFLVELSAHKALTYSAAHKKENTTFTTVSQLRIQKL